jgi:hypothetical protein
LTSVNILSTYKKFPKEGEGGGAGGTGEFILISGTTDRLLVNSTELNQSDGFDILLSGHQCQQLLLISGGTDKILLSGTTDRILIDGYCGENLLASQRRMMKSG